MFWKKLSLIVLSSGGILLSGEEKIVARISDTAWKAWGNNVPVLISRTVEGGKTQIVFQRRDGKAGWNTPMASLNPGVKVTVFTVLKFRCRTEADRTSEINLANATEGAEYAVRFRTVAGQWTEHAVFLKEALYKRGGREGRNPDGILGDEITQIQFACSGREVRIADVRIVEADPSDLTLVPEKNEALEAYLAARKVPLYRQFRRNAVFPFGVISTIGAGDAENGAFFGQTTRERMEEDLRDIRSRGFNAYSNFVDRSGYTTAERLALMKKYHLHLLETATCGTDLHSLPEQHPRIARIRENAFHPNLLAWYGQDEPGDAGLYLKNKIRIESASGAGAPVTSAMHIMAIAKELGPAMDVITLDPYSIGANVLPGKALSCLEKHAALVTMARDFCAGKRVWMIPQAFSGRSSGNRYLRYPDPAEVRFDVFNTLAAGANGYFFFIYNDTVPYLDGKIRYEEFDDTLVDAWGNGNPTTDALGAVGKRLTAIMPSFLERRPMKNSRAVRSDGAELAIRQWDNGDGVLLIAVNRNLRQKISGMLHVTPEPGEKLYDLDTLAELPSASAFSLIPGDAKLLFLGTPQAWRQVETEIRTRHARNEKEIAEVTLREPSGLASVRAAFGEMNAFLTRHGIIEKIDGNAEWSAAREKIKALSRRYFEARRQWRKSGREPDGMRELETEVRRLLAAEQKLLR